MSNEGSPKTYRQLDPASISKALGPDTWFSGEKQTDSPRKKIVASTSLSGLREEFKKTFLPLLIDIFELRQMIENYKSQKISDKPFNFGTNCKSPQEILSRLEEMQSDIEEAQRWCDGVILQISRGITEAKEALSLLDKAPSTEETSPNVTKPPLLKKMLSLFSRKTT